MHDTLATMMTSSRLDQGAGGGQTQAVDVLVDGGVFFDVDVALRNVRFGLIVVVVADEVVDGVVGKEAAKLLVELGGERLVVRQDERRLAELGDDVGGGEGFAAAGDADQDLAILPGLEAAHQSCRWRAADRRPAERD